jgi:ferrochelatase
VLPFLENVTRGRGIPRERLVEVGAHYARFGGVSPINAQNRALLAALDADFVANAVALPVYWGNRNWAPYLVDALRMMRADGIRRALCVVTSAYASYSGCRQYRENLADAVAAVGAGAPRLDKLRHYYDAAGIRRAAGVRRGGGLEQLPQGSRLVFVTHSIPTPMAESSGPPDARGAYVRQHREVAALVAAGVAATTGTLPSWDLVYCSRSGSPAQPWLEPDVNDHLADLAAAGIPGVALAPIGFVSDHMEVRWDLDTEAAATADELGLPFARVPTVGAHPAFVATLRERILERAAHERGEPVARGALGTLGASHDVCPAGCCPNLRGRRPAVAESD